MAFQVGTQVRPELGRADVSGFANAGMITGQALANLGATVGGAIAANKKKKADAELSKAAAGLVLKMADANPEIANQLGIENIEDATIASKVIGPANIMKMISGMTPQEDQGIDAVAIKQIHALLQPGGPLEDVRFDKESGMAYIKGKRGEPVPAAVRNIPYFPEYEKLMGRRPEVTDYEASGISFVD